MNALQLDGYVVWIYGDSPDEKCWVHHAIFTDSEKLAIDCSCTHAGEVYFYSVVLKRSTALVFTGTWTCKDAKQDSGTCECRLYSNGDSIACIGSWLEEGGKQSWYAEFQPKRQNA